LLVSAVIACFSLIAIAGAFAVTRVATELKNGVYYLDAEVDYVFSDSALEALDNGVPLTLEVRVQVRREGAWMWEENLAEQRQLFLIRYQPLSEIYQVVRQPDGPKQSFVTQAAAIAALGEIEDLRLLEQERLEAGEKYRVKVKVSLDIDALPLPLRPVAYLKASWDLSSGWSRWPLEP
jgi:hypothetical protein